jgi:ribonuclease III family protein
MNFNEQNNLNRHPFLLLATSSLESDRSLSSSMAQLSPTSLAYLGDAIYELYVRSYYLLPPRRISEYHDLVVAQVRAETQASHMKAIAPHLDESEREIARRGRNAVKGKPRRLSLAIYQEATSLETLLGYLYLKNPQRLNQLLGQLELDKTTVQ